MAARKTAHPKSLAHPFQYAQADRPGGPLFPSLPSDEIGASGKLGATE